MLRQGRHSIDGLPSAPPRILACVAAALLFTMFAMPALPHDIYSEWKDANGYSCCNSADCRPVRAYLADDGRWVVLIDGRPVSVPPDAVLPIPSPDGRSHVCLAPGALEPRCFVPGEIRG